MLILSEFAPQLGRPYVDTVKDSTFPEYERTPGSASWAPHPRLFAFDPLRKAIVLCAGNKDGMNEKRFYKEMITLADREFSQHLTKER